MRWGAMCWQANDGIYAMAGCGAVEAEGQTLWVAPALPPSKVSHVSRYPLPDGGFQK